MSTKYVQAKLFVVFNRGIQKIHAFTARLESGKVIVRQTCILNKSSLLISMVGSQPTISIMNSHMKDFFDVYMISRQFSFDGRVLYEAIFETFQRRGAVYDKDAAVFSEEFKLLPEKQLQWKAYIKRSVQKDLRFEDVMSRVKTFLRPVFQALVYEREFFGNWLPEQGAWKQ